MTTDEELAAAAADYRAAQHRIRAAVARARQDGLSWAAIGRHFGISKQAAAKKWALELAWSAPLEIDRERARPNMTAVDPDAPRRDLQEAKRRVHRHPNEDCRPGMVRGHLYPCMVFAERQAAATRTDR